MSPRRTLIPILSAALVATTGFGCALDEAGPEDSCEGEKCDGLLDADDDDIIDTACDDSMFDLSGRRNKKVIGRLGDPIAKVLQSSDRCPTSFQELTEILQEATGDCTTRTRVISEQASTIGAFGTVAEAKDNSGYRTVTSRQCAEQERFEVLFSQFGMGSDSAAPADYEAIAFDESEGVFNYYKLHADGTFAWFGNSRDFLTGHGQDVTINQTNTSEKNCARCHVSGGLIMKELPAPWLHWQQGPLPGASDLVDKNSDVFGSLASGANLEGVVKAGNRIWNPERIKEIRKNGTVKDLLRPLFCTQEINLDSSGSRLQNLIDGELSFANMPSSATDYNTVRDENEQTMITFSSSEVTGPDTAKGNTFPFRAEVDTDYVQRLLNDGLIDETLHNAVLMVDFTRPLFSEDRCDLLRFAPDLSLSNKSGLPKKIRDGFIENIGTGATSAARELRRNLIEFKDSPDAAFDKIAAFRDACDGRDSLEATRDVMMLNSLLRSKAREMEIMEFAGSMAFDQFEPEFGAGSSVDPKSRLSPKSCEVVTRFIGVGTPAADE